MALLYQLSTSRTARRYLLLTAKKGSTAFLTLTTVTLLLATAAQVLARQVRDAELRADAGNRLEAIRRAMGKAHTEHGAALSRPGPAVAAAADWTGRVRQAVVALQRHASGIPAGRALPIALTLLLLLTMLRRRV